MADGFDLNLGELNRIWSRASEAARNSRQTNWRRAYERLADAADDLRMKLDRAKTPALSPPADCTPDPIPESIPSPVGDSPG